MYRCKVCIIFTLVSLFHFAAFGQDNKLEEDSIQKKNFTYHIVGKVIDATNGKGIVGAKVNYLNESASITDSSGRFMIGLPDNNTSVRIEGVGYAPKEIGIRGRDSIKVSLYKKKDRNFYNKANLSLRSVPVSHLPFSITSIDTKDNWESFSETPEEYLQGKVAGLNVIRRSGTLGAGANMYIHGISSLYGNNQPLIIVDGVIYDINSPSNSLISGYYRNPLSLIDIKDIENITVLKNGSALYGSKGANGVIFIKTLRAKEEATRIDAAIYGGINIKPVNIPVMNASDYRVFVSEMLQSKGMKSGALKDFPYFRKENDDNTFRYYNRNNWQNLIFRNSSTKNLYLKITGGDNIAKYGLSIGYLNGKGIIRNTNRTRYNARFNADINLSKRLTATANVSFGYSEDNVKNLGLASESNPIYTALVKSPFLPVHSIGENGLPSPSYADSDTFNISNPAALINNSTAFNRNYRFLGSVDLNYRLTPSLSINSDIAVTMDKVRESFFIPNNGVANDSSGSTINEIVENRSGARVARMFSIYNNTHLTFNKTINQVHKLNLSLGVHYKSISHENDKGMGFNAATDDLKNVQYGINNLRKIGGDLQDYLWMNTYFSFNYDYKNKYFLSIDMSLNGSSRNGNLPRNGPMVNIGDKNYSIMPSVSGAWLISSERFLKKNDWIDLLKIRASVGLSGNDDIRNFLAHKIYVSQNLLGMEGLVRGNVVNDKVQLGVIKHLNTGVDIALFNDRLDLTFDYYHKENTNMLVKTPLPVFTGLDYVFINSGKLKTNGWDIGLNTRIINKEKFLWDVGLNVSHYQTIVAKLPIEQSLTKVADATMITQKGHAPNLFFGYETNGVFSSDKAASGLINKNEDGTYSPFKGGDVHFVDKNNDGIINKKDRTIIGNPNPDFYGSLTTKLSYKSWSIKALFTFTQGNDIYNATRQRLESLKGYQNQTQAVRNRWKEEGQITNIPRVDWNDPMENSRFSDRWIEDGSYFRLRSLSLSYKFSFVSGALKYLAIYANGSNLFTLTNYLGYDPEFDVNSGIWGKGINTFNSPQFKKIQLGVRIGL